MTEENLLQDRLILGVDVSEYQGDIDWLTLRTWASFAMIRSGDGMYYQDRRHHCFTAYARAADMPIGHYHVLRPTEGAFFMVGEAILVAVGPRAEGEPIALDIEEPADADPEFTADVASYITEQTGKPPLIYSNKAIIGGFNWEPVIKLGCGLWLADWGTAPGVSPAPMQWPFVAIKQYSDGAMVPGISRKVDTDAFYGSIERFRMYG